MLRVVRRINGTAAAGAVVSHERAGLPALSVDGERFIITIDAVAADAFAGGADVQRRFVAEDDVYVATEGHIARDVHGAAGVVPSAAERGSPAACEHGRIVVADNIVRGGILRYTVLVDVVNSLCPRRRGGEQHHE